MPFVHIERMDTTSFWIGINLPDGQTMHVRTGVQRGVWFFTIEEDKAGGGFWHSVQRPRGLKIETAVRKAKAGKKGK